MQHQKKCRANRRGWSFAEDGNGTRASCLKLTGRRRLHRDARREEHQIELDKAAAAPLATPLVPATRRGRRASAPACCGGGLRHALRVRGVRVDAAVRSPQTHALAAHEAGGGRGAAAGLACPMPGTLLRFEAEVGATVEAGEPLAVVEAICRASCGPRRGSRQASRRRRGVIAADRWLYVRG